MIDVRNFLAAHKVAKAIQSAAPAPTPADLRNIYDKARRLASRAGFDADSPAEILAALDTLMFQATEHRESFDSVEREFPDAVNRRAPRV